MVRHLFQGLHALDYVRAVRSRRLDLIDARLLVLSFALEGLHRVLHAHEQHCSKDEFNRIFKTIKPGLRKELADAGAPRSLRERFYQAVGQANELSFGERIAGLSEFLGNYVNLPILRWTVEEINQLIPSLRNIDLPVL